MRVVVDMSNLVHGGGAQIGSWLSKKLLNDTENWQMLLLCSPKIYDYLINFGNFHTDEKVKLVLINSSPARSKSSRVKAMSIIRGFQADLYFSLLGPTYLSGGTVNISGVANAWITCARISDFYDTYGKSFILYYLKFFVHGLTLRKYDYLYFETELSRNNFCNRFKYSLEKTFIIPNTVNDYIFNSKKDAVIERNANTTPCILVFGTWAKHKNLHRLIDIAKANRGEKFKFCLTLPNEDYEFIFNKAKHEGVEGYFYNIGFVEANKIPELYKSVDLVMSLSSMETFSAIYPEALFFGKRLIVLNKDFAKKICKDSAIYVNLDNVEDIVCKIHENIIKSNDRDFFDYFITPGERYNKFKSIIKNVIK